MKNETPKKCKVTKWLSDSLTSEVRGLIDLWALTDDVWHIAVMPDVHYAEDACVGSVFATQQLVFPGAIGSDLGCGMATVRIQGDERLLEKIEKAEIILNRIKERVPVSRFSRQKIAEIPEKLSKVGLSAPRLESSFKETGKLEFATLGSGNHFIELQADEFEGMWVMVHTGSRGMGQLIRKHHLELSKKTKSGFFFIPAESHEGKAFLNDLNWAIEYARASRLRIIENVCLLLKEIFLVEPEWGSMIDCCHNSILRETHFERALWVHRKGANSANLGEAGIIPGAMGKESYLVQGRGCHEALCSSSHGAGRCMSRLEARKKISRAAFLKSMGNVWFDQKSLEKMLDEAPQAYKDIRSVMRAQRDLVKITHRLRPILSFKGV